MSAMIEHADIRMRYYAKAKQFLYDRSTLEIADDNLLASTAEYLRHQDLLLATQLYVEQKRRMVSRYFELQANPTTWQLPKELEEALASWDELIEIEARKLGFEPTSARTGAVE